MKKTLIIALSLTILFLNLSALAQSTKRLNVSGRNIKNPVTYADAKAFSDGRGVWLEWRTEVETRNLGFYIYRITGGVKELASPVLISGAYSRAQKEQITSGDYSFFDRSGNPDSVYLIESFNLNGQRNNSDFIQTQRVADLSVITGVSSDELDYYSRNAEPTTLRSESILPKDLASEVGANSLSPDPVTQHWVAAQPGVKIGVKSEGLYRVSRASLQAGGFNVNTPSARWQLYLNGVEQAINIGGNGDYIEFYGKRLDTPDSNTETYFLVIGPQSGKRMGNIARRRIGGSVVSSNYSQTTAYRERFIYSSNILNEDIENYFGTIISEDGDTVSFNLSGVDFNSPGSSIDINIQGFTFVPHQTKITLNNVELGTVSGNEYNATIQHYEIPTSILREGTNSLQFLALAGSSDVSLFSSVKVNFARKYKAVANQLSFYVPNYKQSYVEDFTSPNVRIFDLTNPDEPLLVTGLTVESNNGSFRVNLPSNRSKVLFAVDDSAILTPFSVAPNLPSTLSGTDNNGELIIISHKNWLTQAEDWANYRRTQGMIVKVVNIEDVYDEFNYGVLKADAIRDFLSYAKTNWQTAPNYVLLLGDATYDPKNLIGIGGNNFVSTRLVDTIYTETGSDETLADFNNDGLAEIAIGRIPARNAATVTLALNKVMTFEQNVAQGLNRGAIFGFDEPNGFDFEGLSYRLRDQLPSNIPRIMVSRLATGAHTQLINEMNNGRFLVNYSGHGNVGVWGGGDFFTSTDAAALTNGNNLSIFTMLTCLNGYFIQPADTMAEVLLKNPNGGAVATWASTGLTTADIQEVMATRYYNQIAAGNMTRLGDLIKDAKTTISFGRDVRLSWVLLGDPTLKTR